MGNPFDDLAAVQEVARAIRARADLVHDAVAQARAALDGADYECAAAARQREDMVAIARHAHACGDALCELTADLLRRAAALGSGQG
jgi:hypothetical protein